MPNETAKVLVPVALGGLVICGGILFNYSPPAHERLHRLLESPETWETMRRLFEAQ